MEFGSGLNGRPNDERGFLHKKLLGVVSKVAGVVSRVAPIPGIGLVRDITGALAGGGRGRGFVPRTQLARISESSVAAKRSGTLAKFGPESIGPTALNLPQVFGGAGAGPCQAPLVLAPDGHCVAPGSGHFIQHFGNGGGAGAPVGDAVMGRFGAALTPGSLIIDRAVCLKGMQLAVDGLCYNKSQISNKQRMWPAGRKPLLSGGDMRAIGIAARAGRRLEGATKRLQRLGMMKKPLSRRLAPHQHAKLLPAVSIT